MLTVSDEGSTRRGRSGRVGHGAPSARACWHPRRIVPPRQLSLPQNDLADRVGRLELRSRGCPGMTTVPPAMVPRTGQGNRMRSPVNLPQRGASTLPQIGCLQEVARVAPGRGPSPWDLSDARRATSATRTQPASECAFDQRLAWQPRSSTPAARKAGQARAGGRPPSDPRSPPLAHYPTYTQAPSRGDAWPPHPCAGLIESSRATLLPIAPCDVGSTISPRGTGAGVLDRQSPVRRPGAAGDQVRRSAGAARIRSVRPAPEPPVAHGARWR